MKSSLDSNEYKCEPVVESILETPGNIKGDTVEELQAKILQLETELKKQKDAAEKGSKLLKLMWGDRFETDSLH